MKGQYLFSLKIKQMECRLLQILFGLLKLMRESKNVTAKLRKEDGERLKNAYTEGL